MDATKGIIVTVLLIVFALFIGRFIRVGGGWDE